jgi:hypothetical protein
LGLVRVRVRPGGAQLASHPPTLGLRQMIEDVLRLPALIAGPRFGGVRVHLRR